jgi:DNA-binding transcriptional MerR regulator
MPDHLLTLAELSKRSGVEVRTLRSWIAQRVVPGPETIGRNARYSPAALSRVRAAKALRELYNMSLTAIRQELIAADAARIEAYAEMAQPGQEAPDGLAEAAAPSGTSAADYLRKLRRSGAFGTQGPATAAQPVPPRQDAPARRFAPAGSAEPSRGSRLSRLVAQLERIAGPRPSRRKAKGEARLKIAITPDLALMVRGDHTPEEIARFEQIADLLQSILTGGKEHD